MRHPYAFKDQRGLTMVEVMVGFLLFTVISLTMHQLLIGTTTANGFLEGRNDLTTFGQRVVNELRGSVAQSRMLFEDDTIGGEYLAKLVIHDDWPVAAGSRLPVIDQTGNLEPDTTGNDRTGNSFLSVRELEPLLVMVDHDNDSSTADVEFLADRFTFEYVYLSENTSRDFARTGSYLDLVRGQSRIYANYFQLSGLSSLAKTQAGAALAAADVNFAWNPRQPHSSAFYRIQSSGLLSARPNHNINVKQETASLLPEFVGGRVHAALNYSVAPQTPAYDVPDTVSLFANATSDFPGGFEVQICGPSGARRILMRLVLLSDQHKNVSSHSNTVVAYTAEF